MLLIVENNGGIALFSTFNELNIMCAHAQKGKFIALS